MANGRGFGEGDERTGETAGCRNRVQAHLRTGDSEVPRARKAGSVGEGAAPSPEAAVSCAHVVRGEVPGELAEGRGADRGGLRSPGAPGGCHPLAGEEGPAGAGSDEGEGRRPGLGLEETLRRPGADRPLIDLVLCYQDRGAESRAGYVLAGGGGHAGALLRSLVETDEASEGVIVLLGELIGRVHDLERTVGRLEGELLNVRHQIIQIDRRGGGR